MILAIDTATPSLVVGLLGTDSGFGHETVEHVDRAHAERLPQAVQTLLALRPQDGGDRPAIDLLVVGTGPGSYTGLRVGASHALGLARAWNVPVVGVPTLEGIAARAEGRVAVSLDARKGQVYGAVYEVDAGQVVAVHHAPAKHPADDFAEVARNTTWLHDEPPGGLALARLGPTRGQVRWQLTYA